MDERKDISLKVSMFANLVKRHDPGAKVILFGSSVKDTWIEGSDVDILVISDRFKRIRFIERGLDLLKEWEKVNSDKYIPLHLTTLTNEEFNESFVMQKIVSNEGKEI